MMYYNLCNENLLRIKNNLDGGCGGGGGGGDGG